MRILVLDGAGAEMVAALLECGPAGLSPVGRTDLPGRGGAERLAGVVQALLAAAGWEHDTLGLIAAVTGPGSFTGLRATLSLAHGFALGSSALLHGVSLAEALRRSVGETAGRPLWCVSIARPDRIFLQTEARADSRGCMLDALPPAPPSLLLAGDAAGQVAARLPHAVASPVERPYPWAIASAALERSGGGQPALPLYVDPPEAKLPAGGLRPPPSC